MVERVPHTLRVWRRLDDGPPKLIAEEALPSELVAKLHGVRYLLQHQQEVESLLLNVSPTEAT